MYMFIFVIGVLNCGSVWNVGQLCVNIERNYHEKYQQIHLKYKQMKIKLNLNMFTKVKKQN